MSRLPTILYLNAWDSEDYGVQYLYDGLCDLLGWQQVIDWPSNPYLHKRPFEERDYDADLGWPDHHFHEHHIRDLLRAGAIDLVVLSSARTLALGTALQLLPWLGSVQAFVALDMEDSREANAWQMPESLRSGLRVLFKREWTIDSAQQGPPGLPILPLPFAYPRSRMVGLAKPDDGPLVFYHACDWGWESDSPRHRMVRALQERFGERADVGLSSCTDKVWTNRLSNGDYHLRLWRSRIGVAVNQGGGSDNNRYWETVAHGCVLVSDRPRHEIPDNFVDGQEAFFYATPEEAVEIIARLDADPALYERVRQAGMAKFDAHHTTLARATYLLNGITNALLATGQRPRWWV